MYRGYAKIYIVKKGGLYMIKTKNFKIQDINLDVLIKGYIDSHLNGYCGGTDNSVYLDRWNFHLQENLGISQFPDDDVPLLLMHITSCFDLEIEYARGFDVGMYVHELITCKKVLVNYISGITYL